MVKEVIIVKRDFSLPAQRINLNLRSARTIKVNIPENSIFVVVGSTVAWNTTPDQVNFNRKIECLVESSPTFYFNIVTNDFSVNSLDNYSFSFKTTLHAENLNGLSPSIHFATRNILRISVKLPRSGTYTIIPPKTQFPGVKFLSEAVVIKAKSSGDVSIPNTKFAGLIPSPGSRMIPISQPQT